MSCAGLKGTDLDNNLVLDVIKNFRICKKFYSNSYNATVASLDKYLLSVSRYIIEAISRKTCLISIEKTVF